jgi:uncharacterized coiled-coil protein SlyX
MEDKNVTALLKMTLEEAEFALKIQEEHVANLKKCKTMEELNDAIIDHSKNSKKLSQVRKKLAKKLLEFAMDKML